MGVGVLMPESCVSGITSRSSPLESERKMRERETKRPTLLDGYERMRTSERLSFLATNDRDLPGYMPDTSVSPRPITSSP